MASPLRTARPCCHCATMANGWGQLAGVCAVLLLLSSTTWPRYETRSIPSTSKALMDPTTAKYENFDPASASLRLVQVVFRHGARTPLNAIYSFQGANWTHCKDHYKGMEVQLHDENGGRQPPPILDTDTPELPGGCRQGTLTEAGYGMARDLGSWLRRRYVAPAGSGRPAAGGSAAGGTLGFLPDFGPGAAWNPAIAALRTTPIRRTVATLRGVLTGLWPKLAESTGPGARGGQPPLPVGASLQRLEIMYGNNDTCPRLGVLHAAMQRDLDAADARDSQLPLLNRMVAEALGLDPSKDIIWSKLYDTLVGMIADGAPLPPGATREVLDIIWAQAERHEASIIAPGVDLCASLGPGGAGGDSDSDDGDGSAARRRRCHAVLRLGIGMLVQRLLDNMERHVASAAATARSPSQSGTPSQLYLFSGHDSSVMPLLAVLGQPANAWPPFASDIVFELWELPASKAGGRRRALMGRRDLVATAAGGSEGGSGAISGSDGARGAGRGSVGANAAVGGEAGAKRVAGVDGMEKGAESGADLQAGGYWVRILYNSAPLVVPWISDAGGWAPLGVLRQRVLLPYAIAPAEHSQECDQVDISDLQTPLPPSQRHRVLMSASREGSGARDGGTAADMRQQDAMLRHATL